MPPSNSLPVETNRIRVLAAVIQRSGELLVCQRPHHKRHGGLWEFPGGKVEPGETDFTAAARELKEELGVDVSTVGAAVFTVRDPGSAFVIEFVPVTIAGEPRALEHEQLRWLVAGDLESVDLAPADLAFARWLGSGGGG